MLLKTTSSAVKKPGMENNNLCGKVEVQDYSDLSKRRTKPASLRAVPNYS